MPMISVLMPAYNSAKYIKESINSILNQSFTDFELIIINDGSTDNTHEVITSFTDPRIKYYQNDGNKGLMFVRNRLLQIAQCNILAFLDSDDFSERNRLELEYAFLKTNNSIGLVSSSVQSLDEAGNIDKESWRFNLNANQLKTHLLFYNPIVTSTVMFKREILPEVHFRNGYPPCEDYDLWVRMLLNNKGTVLKNILSTYRLYHNSVSKRKADDAKKNRDKVILDQLGYYFPNLYSTSDAELHLSLVDFSLKNTIADLPEMKAWILKLLQLNQQFHHFDESILKQVLYERVLKKYLRLSAYNFSVIKNLLEIKKILKPKVSWELRKKEAAIAAFSIANKKLIQL